MYLFLAIYLVQGCPILVWKQLTSPYWCGVRWHLTNTACWICSLFYGSYTKCKGPFIIYCWVGRFVEGINWNKIFIFSYYNFLKGIKMISKLCLEMLERPIKFHVLAGYWFFTKTIYVCVHFSTKALGGDIKFSIIKTQTIPPHK